jgi:hypothetical protein
VVVDGHSAEDDAYCGGHLHLQILICLTRTNKFYTVNQFLSNKNSATRK